jgi:hypothetical protein
MVRVATRPVLEQPELALSQVIARSMHEMTIRTSAETANPPPAPEDDEKVVRDIQFYIDGFNEPDKRKFHWCFHENAWMGLRMRSIWARLLKP